ncbi:MAG: glycosyl hydrolase 115 family protein [Prevotella sp.]|nr:glycosyl hydrolase 115 family protein [Prevotella sp.]
MVLVGRCNGKYENTYTLGLRGIHDYTMEGANGTAERVALMQQAIDDQREILRRNINQSIENIPQILCTYEEVLDAYHHGLKVPDDVTLLWSDDKHGYCRNLSNPEEQKRKGGAGIYYHLSYHGDPASWIWLSPLSTPFLSTELTKAYTFGARKIWVFNVGDIKPAEKEISFVMDLFTGLNSLTHQYNDGILNGKWQGFFSWQPYHWFRSEKIEQPVATPELTVQARRASRPRFVSVSDALSDGGALIESDIEADIPVWMEALTPIRNFSKAPEDNIFCHITTGQDSFDASATPINNVWHASSVGPMWSQVGTIHLSKGDNRIYVKDLKEGTHIYRIFIGLYPPFVKEPRVRIPASHFLSRQESIELVKGLGYTDGLAVYPFYTPSYHQENLKAAPSVTFEIDLQPADTTIEIRTLPTLHVYDGRDARYAVQLGDSEPAVFSIHANDFTPEWRLNVLRGYESRTIPANRTGKQLLHIYLLDPCIVLQEVLIHSKE